MIIGIQMPEGATATVTKDNKVLISFDERATTRDLWIARLHLWLVAGHTAEDFWANKAITQKVLEIPPGGKTIKLEKG